NPLLQLYSTQTLLSPPVLPYPLKYYKELLSKKTSFQIPPESIKITSAFFSKFIISRYPTINFSQAPQM
ncbi:MAG: hypothetical protein C0196_08245, partial [Dictyoglomus turgidum]